MESDGTEEPPRPAAELAALADYYDEHDTADEMEAGWWVAPASGWYEITWGRKHGE